MEETGRPCLKGSADLLEGRRRRALVLWDTGLSLNEVGRRIGCAASSLLRWVQAQRRRDQRVCGSAFCQDSRPSSRRWEC